MNGFDNRVQETVLHVCFYVLSSQHGLNVANGLNNLVCYVRYADLLRPCLDCR